MQTRLSSIRPDEGPGMGLNEPSDDYSPLAFEFFELRIQISWSRGVIPVPFMNSEVMELTSTVEWLSFYVIKFGVVCCTKTAQFFICIKIFRKTVNGI